MAAGAGQTILNVLASMRPTPEGVGNMVRKPDYSVLTTASMRPTPEGVGNCRVENTLAPAHRGFNEAHARRRGK